MSFAVAGSIGAGLIVGGATIYAANKGADAAENAANIQAGAAQAGIDEQRKQFAAIQEILKPYTQAGTQAMGAQQALLGLAGPEAQAQAIQGIQNSPAFQAMSAQGENAILQNASATGGLRGGNIQAALAQFRPQMLSQLIQQQYQNLGGLSSLGQSSAAGVGNAGMQTGMNVANLLGEQGAAMAGGALAEGQRAAAIPNGIASGLGAFVGLGGLQSFKAPSPTGSTVPTVNTYSKSPWSLGANINGGVF